MVREKTIGQNKKNVPKWQRPSVLFWKATGNATAGLPIALTMNMVFLPPFATLLGGTISDQFLAASIIAIPFITVSIFRQWIIDLVWVKYKINISPIHLFRSLYNRMRYDFKEGSYL